MNIQQNKTLMLKLVCISIIILMILPANIVIATSVSSVDTHTSVQTIRTFIRNKINSILERFRLLREQLTLLENKDSLPLDGNKEEPQGSMEGAAAAMGATSIYIDPTYTGTSDGTIEHPYKGWDDVTIQSNTNYLQKTGTTYTVPTYVNAVIDITSKTNVAIGSYGSGSKPIIRDVNGYTIRMITIAPPSTDITIDGLELIGSSSSTGVGIRLDGSSNPNTQPIKNINILNCDIHKFGTGTWYIPWETPYSNQAEKFTLRNCKIYDIGTDGVFWVEIKDIVIEDCYIYDVALIYDAGGDGIHLVEGCPNYLIKNNIIDRRGTAGKFCFIHGFSATFTGTTGRITGNTLYSPDDDPLGGSALYLAGNDAILVDHNKFLGGGQPAIHEVYDENVEVAYNLFYNVAVNGVIQADYSVKIHNNIIMSTESNADAYFLFSAGGDGVCQLWNNIIASNNLPLGGIHLAYGNWNQKNNLIQDSNPSGWQSYFGIVNWATGDLHLTANSIARDAGYTYSGYTYDLDGNPTPQGIRDIGCYEYTVGGTPYYSLTVNSGSGSGSYIQGSTVPIVANTPPGNQVFDKWTGSGAAYVANVNAASTTVTMPAVNITVTATYTTPTSYILTVNSGSGSGSYLQGTVVAIVANAAPSGQVFDKWTGSGAAYVANVNAASTTVTMPGQNIMVTATYKLPASYTLTVNSGSGSGSYLQGTIVSIVANAPPANQVFDQWTGTGAPYVANVNTASTTLTMPAQNIAVTATYKNAPIGQALVASYSFDENTGSVLHDLSEFENHGAIASEATWMSNGKYGSALQFSGSSNAYVAVSDAESLDLTSGMTLMAWVRPTTVQGWRPAVCKDPEGKYHLYVSSTSQFNNAPGGGIDPGEQVFDSGALPLNQWSHLATTYNRQTLTIYVNGILKNSIALTDTIVTSNDPLYIGASVNWNEYYSGSIDEVRIYNYALTQSQIQTDMNTPIGNPVTSYTLTVNNGTGSGLYQQSTTVPISAAAAPTGKVFDKWIGTAGDIEHVNNINLPSTTVTMPNHNVVVTATYKNIQYYLNITVQGTGIVTKNPNQQLYSPGQVVTLTATPATGWTFSQWTGDLSGSINPAQITMNGNKAVLSVFAENTSSVSTLTVINGSGSGTYAQGSVVPIIANTPPSGSIFHIWSGNTECVDNIHLAATTVTIPNYDVTVMAIYTVVPTGQALVAAYSFNEGTGAVLTDSSGFGNNGQIQAATWTNNGKYGNALSFNGASSMVTIADSISLDLTTAITMEAWIYPISMSGTRCVLMKNLDRIYGLYSSNGHGKAGTILNIDDVPGYQYLKAKNSLPLFTWSHLAATYDGSIICFYVNGVKVAQKTVSGVICDTDDPLTIGGNLLWGQMFKGLIDEVRIYNYARSQTQIEADKATPLV